MPAQSATSQPIRSLFPRWLRLIGRHMNVRSQEKRFGDAALTPRTLKDTVAVFMRPGKRKNSSNDVLTVTGKQIDRWKNS